MGTDPVRQRWVLQHRLQFSAGDIPLLYGATPAVFMSLALPLGHLADRLGRTRVIVGGYGTPLLVYLAVLAPLPPLPAVALTVTLLGVCYAATDGVLMALGSALLPVELRASGALLDHDAQQPEAMNVWVASAPDRG